MGTWHRDVGVECEDRGWTRRTVRILMSDSETWPRQSRLWAICVRKILGMVQYLVACFSVRCAPGTHESIKGARAGVHCHNGITRVATLQRSLSLCLVGHLC